MIRTACRDDLEHCIILAREFYEAFMNFYGITVNDEDIKRTTEFFIRSKQLLVVEQDYAIVGMAAWVVSGHPANVACRIFQEVLWCCKSPYKTDALLLLRALEQKAIEVKANLIILANLALENEPALRRIYGKRGYSYMETHYAKTGG